MDAILALINSVFDLIYGIYEFLFVGLYDFFSSFADYIIIYFKIWFYDLGVWLMEFFWSVAREILQSVNVSSYLAQAFGSISSDIFQVLAFFRFFDAINVLVAASTTRFLLRLIPFF